MRTNEKEHEGKGDQIEGSVVEERKRRETTRVETTHLESNLLLRDSYRLTNRPEHSRRFRPSMRSRERVGFKIDPSVRKEENSVELVGREDGCNAMESQYLEYIAKGSLEGWSRGRRRGRGTYKV